MANDKEKNVEQPKSVVQPTANDIAKATLRTAYKDATKPLSFDRGDAQEGKVTDALKKLNIAFTLGDMPYKTIDGMTYKHTVFIKDVATLQAILDGKD